MGLFDASYDDQLAAINRRSVFNAQVGAAGVNATPAQAQNVAAQSRAYPWMAPQTAYALGANGNQPGDPVSQAVATASINKKGGGFWHSLGHVVTAPLRSAVHVGSVAIQDVQHYGKAAARDAFTIAETPLQVGSGVFRDVASAGGDIAAGFASGAAVGAGIGVSGGIFGGVGVIPGVLGGALIGGGLGAIAQARGVKVEGGVVNPLAQSSGGVAAGQLFSGKGVDLGSGFLPGGTVREQQVKNAQAAASINGHALTPGRFIAASVLRPDSLPYNVLSGAADAITTWNLDPTRYVAEEASAARAAGKLIPGAAEVEAGPITQVARNLSGRAGILDTAEPAVLHARADEFLTTDRAAQRFLDRAVESTSASEIRDASKGKLPAQIANQLAATTDRQDALEVLRNGVLGGELKYRDAVRSGRNLLENVQTFKPAARLAATMDRLGGVLPEHSVDLLDIDAPSNAGWHKLDNATDQLQNWMKQVRFPADQRAPILDRLMATKTAEEAKQVLTQTVHGDFRDYLRSIGTDEDTINRVLKTGADDEALLGSQVHQELATGAVPASVNVGGEEIPLNQPNLVKEHLENTFDFPSTKDLREIRRLTTPTATPVGQSLSALYNSDGWKSSMHALEWSMGKWKIGNIARPALAVRMLAMETAKQAANGLQTAWSDPVALFRMMLNPEIRPQMWEGLREGTPLSHAEEFLKAQSRVSGHVDADLAAAHSTTLRPGDDGFTEAWSHRVAELHADPVARAVATDGYDTTAASFWDGPLADERERLIADGNNALASRDGADAYIHDTIKSHFTGVTADNPDLLEAISTGRIGADGPHLLTLDAQAERIETVARQAADEAAAKLTKNIGSFGGPRSATEDAAEIDTVERAAQRAAQKAARSTAEEHLGERGAVGPKGMAQRTRPVPLAMGSAPKSLSVAERAAIEEARTTAYEAAKEAGQRAAIKEAGGRIVNPDLDGHLEGLIGDSEVTVPNTVKAARPRYVDPDYGNKVGRMTQWFYSTLVGKPMNFLVRSPEFNELYWREVASQAHLLDGEGAEALRGRLAAAGTSPLVNVPKDTQDVLAARLAGDGIGQGAVNIDHLDQLAKMRALDGVQSMTIQMANKNGWQDAMRIMSPFAKHWQQEVSQWARLAVDHPEAFRKAQMTVQGAQGSGFFDKDDQGNWVFRYPGSNLINKVAGAPFPLTAKAGGLSMLTTDILPSFGPVVSLPASKLLPNSPDFDEVRNFLAPYGDPTAQGTFNAVAPAWARTLKAALSKPDSRDTANTTMQVARYLVSTGKFSTATPEDTDRLLKEAGSRAKRILALQAIGKFVLPSSPAIQPMAQDKDGRTVVAKLLSTDLQKMRQDDFEHSSENFLAKYGDGAMLFLQSATRPIVPGAATTKEQEDFTREHPELKAALPNTYAFFAPQGGQTYDYNSTIRRIHQGELQSLSPEQQIALANDQVGSMQYYQLKSALGPRISSAQQAILTQIKGVLRSQYPGFDTIIPGLGARATDDPTNIGKSLIPELQKGLQNDVVANSDTGRALKSYLDLRDAAMAASAARGNKPESFATSPKAADLRNILRQGAAMLSQNNEGFGMLFDRILDRELRTDTTPAAGAVTSA
jgi:hypothetical protein